MTADKLFVPRPGLITAVWVPGIARTKGSLNFHGEGKVSEGVKFSKEWRVEVRKAVRADRDRRGLTEPSRGPVAVRMRCWVEASNDGDGTSIGRGDLDKLQRNVGDALADKAYDAAKAAFIPGTQAIFNDNQIIVWDPAKHVGRPLSMGYGMYLEVWELDGDEAHRQSVAAAENVRRFLESGKVDWR
jgi:hypothetical protein